MGVVHVLEQAGDLHEVVTNHRFVSEVVLLTDQAYDQFKSFLLTINRTGGVYVRRKRPAAGTPCRAGRISGR